MRGAGIALLPYYKTILPLINGFKNRSSEMSRELSQYTSPALMRVFRVQTAATETRLILQMGGIYKPRLLIFWTVCMKQVGRRRFLRCVASNTRASRMVASYVVCGGARWPSNAIAVQIKAVIPTFNFLVAE